LRLVAIDEPLAKVAKLKHFQLCDPFLPMVALFVCSLFLLLDTLVYHKVTGLLGDRLLPPGAVVKTFWKILLNFDNLSKNSGDLSANGKKLSAMVASLVNGMTRSI
jgi:hypothetical protein